MRLSWKRFNCSCLGAPGSFSPLHPLVHFEAHYEVVAVFADALADRASAVVVAHNHPAGNLEPSVAGIEVTAQLKASGAVLGVSLLDHIIFNRTGYFSFLESGKL